MTLTHKHLVAAAEANGWHVAQFNRFAVATRDGVRLSWVIRGRVRGLVRQGGMAVSDLNTRADVLDMLERSVEDLRPAVAYLQVATGATVVEHQVGQDRFVEHPPSVMHLREHLAADHGASPYSVHETILPAVDVELLHRIHHDTGQTPVWPYINAHHHIDTRSLSAATLLETT